MSHFTTIQTQIRDLEALADACAELGLSLTPNLHVRGYAAVTRPAPHGIKLKGPYDIAVDPSPENDGSFGLTTDWWDGHVAREVGPGYCRLIQSYGVHKTLREAGTRGLRATRRNQGRRLHPPHPRRRCPVSRRILVHVSALGEITVEAEGFKGQGCEAATRAIEEALGRKTERTRKADYWRQARSQDQSQQLGGENENAAS